MNIAFDRPRCLGIILGILCGPEMMQNPASQMPIWRYPLSFLKTSLFRATSMAFLPRFGTIILNILEDIHILGFGGHFG